MNKFPFYLLAFLAVNAFAQVRPDAGSILREQRPRLPEAPREAKPMLQPAEDRPALQAAPDARFNVRSVRIRGNTAFPESELLPLVKDLVGREVSLKQLQDAAARITAYYRARGFIVARAYIPAQRMEGGAVEIAVLEGLLGGVSLQNRSLLSDATATRFLAPLAPGTPVHAETVERQLLLLSDQPGVGAVTPVLRPGATTGTSALGVELAPGPRATGALELDNYGNRFSGKNRITGSANVNSPFGLGETFSLRVTESDGDMQFLRLLASAPLGGQGLRMGLAYVDSSYGLGKDFAALQANGTARVGTAFASYPFLRSTAVNVNGSVSWDAKRIEDRVDSTATVTPKRNDSATFTLSGDLRDKLLDGSLFIWSAAYSSGRLAIDSAAAKATDDTAARTAGHYEKWNGTFYYIKELPGPWSLSLSGQAQRAGKNLDSSEKFALGGPFGVRAYPQGEAPGDEGILLSAEVRYLMQPVFGATPAISAFIDQGEIKINRNPFATGSNTRHLGGAGVGLTFAKAGDYSLRWLWSWKTTSSPATADNDRNGRGWVQLVKSF